MTSCTHVEGHEFLDAVCIHCGTEDGLGRAPLFQGLRAIQEQHRPVEIPIRLDEFGNRVTEKCCSWCTYTGPQGSRFAHPCKTRQLADKALGENNA